MYFDFPLQMQMAHQPWWPLPGSNLQTTGRRLPLPDPRTNRFRAVEPRAQEGTASPTNKPNRQTAQPSMKLQSAARVATRGGRDSVTMWVATSLPAVARVCCTVYFGASSIPCQEGGAAVWRLADKPGDAGRFRVQPACAPVGQWGTSVDLEKVSWSGAPLG